MAEKENYVIRVEGNVVEVSPEVYYAYFHMERQERGQEEKKQRNAVVSYDALDSDETVGLETINTLDLDSEMLITMLGAFAQAESESMSRNIAWGKRQAIREGKIYIAAHKILPVSSERVDREK